MLHVNMNRRVAQRQALDETPPRRNPARPAQTPSPTPRIIPETPMNIHGVPMTRQVEEDQRMEDIQSEMQRMRDAGEDLTNRVRLRHATDRDLYDQFMILFDENINDIASLGQEYPTMNQSIERINLLRRFLNRHVELEFEDTEGDRLIRILRSADTEYNRDQLTHLINEVRRRTDPSLEYIRSLFDASTDEEDDDDE